MKTLEASFLFLLLLASCERKQSVSEQKIAGVYTRETSFEVKHPETDKLIGRSTIRDTLFIQQSGAGFQVRQSKWRRNDFDQQGWHDQRHAEHRPTPTYRTIFDPVNSCLRPSSPAVAVPLYVEAGQGILYQESNRQHPYRKVP